MDYAIRTVFCQTQLFTRWQIDTISCVSTDRFKPFQLCVAWTRSEHWVNEVTALTQCRALWSAENEALPGRKALWSTESQAKNHSEILKFSYLSFIFRLWKTGSTWLLVESMWGRTRCGVKLAATIPAADLNDISFAPMASSLPSSSPPWTFYFEFTSHLQMELKRTRNKHVLCGSVSSCAQCCLFFSVRER